MSIHADPNPTEIAVDGTAAQHINKQISRSYTHSRMLMPTFVQLIGLRTTCPCRNGQLDQRLAQFKMLGLGHTAETNIYLSPAVQNLQREIAHILEQMQHLCLMPHTLAQHVSTILQDQSSPVHKSVSTAQHTAESAGQLAT